MEGGRGAGAAPRAARRHGAAPAALAGGESLVPSHLHMGGPGACLLAPLGAAHRLRDRPSRLLVAPRHGLSPGPARSPQAAGLALLGCTAPRLPALRLAADPLSCGGGLQVLLSLRGWGNKGLKAKQASFGCLIAEKDVGWIWLHVDPCGAWFEMGWCRSENHRIIRIGKTTEIIESNHQPVPVTIHVCGSRAEVQQSHGERWVEPQGGHHGGLEEGQAWDSAVVAQ